MRKKLRDLRQSLSLRLVVLLTIAILPLGLIAVYQTFNVVSEVENLARRDILARTKRAAEAELALIRQAHGAGYALGAVGMALEPKDCIDVLARFVDDDPRFVFAAIIDGGTGKVSCSSAGDPVDVSQRPIWQDFKSDPRPTVYSTPAGAASGLPVLVAFVPIFGPSESFLGAVAISIPQNLADILIAEQIEGIDAAIIDKKGRVLTDGTDLDRSKFFEFGIVPERMTIPYSGLTVDVVFEDETTTVAVVPILPDETFVLSAPAEESEPAAVSILSTAMPLFPVLMWLAGLFVAIFAIEKLVLGHLRVLRRRMAGFSTDDLEGSLVTLSNAPNEINDIAASYNALVEKVTADTAELEKNVVEKEVLLKEVHHRVKNNLQLIASILNMQLRQISSPDAQDVLRRVQDRVMSLANIHKLLYTDTRVDTVRADLLLSEIISSVVNLGAQRSGPVETEVSLAPVELDPDLAVPLSLLLTEALTNAMKYVGTDGETKPSISVKLSVPTAETVELVVENSVGSDESTVVDESSNGLGSRLIAAFVTQLEGTQESGRSGEAYLLRVSFPKNGMADHTTPAD